MVESPAGAPSDAQSTDPSVGENEQREEKVLRQAFTQSCQPVRAAWAECPYRRELAGQCSKLMYTVNNAAHVGVRKLCLAQHEPTELLMPLTVQVHLGIDLGCQDSRHAGNLRMRMTRRVESFISESSDQPLLHAGKPVVSMKWPPA